jgi:hypothetical protein
MVKTNGAEGKSRGVREFPAPNNGIPWDTIPFQEKGVMSGNSRAPRNSCGRIRRYMLMEMLLPPLPKRGLTTLLRVEPKEKLSPTEKE